MKTSSKIQQFCTLLLLLVTFTQSQDEGILKLPLQSTSEHPMLRDSVTSSQMSVGNHSVYYVDIYFGSLNAKASLVLDTGIQDWTTVTSVECKSCDHTVYDDENSLSANSRSKNQQWYDFTFYQLPKANENSQPLNPRFSGFQIKDRICLSSSDTKCTSSQMKFVEMKYSSDWPQVDGFLVIQPSEMEDGTSLLRQLKANDVIYESMISISLGADSAEESTVMFGGYDKQLIRSTKDGSDIFWYQSTSKTAWEIRTQDFYIADQKFRKSNTFSSTIDSQNPVIVFPFDDYIEFGKILNDIDYTIECDLDSNVQGCVGSKKCKEYKNEIPYLEFQVVDDATSDILFYSLPFDTFTQDIDGVGCYFLIQKPDDASQDHVSLGIPFLKSFYTVLNEDNQSLGLGLNTFQGDSWIDDKPRSQQDPDENKEKIENYYMDIVMIVLGVIILALLVFAFIYKQRQDSKKKAVQDPDFFTHDVKASKKQQLVHSDEREIEEDVDNKQAVGSDDEDA